MATPTVTAALGKMTSRRPLFLLAVLALVISVANALSSIPALSDYALDQFLTLQLTVPSGSGDAPTVRHKVVPLTEAAGMNQSAIEREVGRHQATELQLSLMNPR